MAWDSPLKDMANYKPIFLMIYASVVIGIMVSSLYVFSAVYSSSSSSSPSSYGFSSDSPASNQASNSCYFNLSVSNVTMVSISQSRKKLNKPVWKVPPSGSKMPPLKTFGLTKKLIQQRAKDNIIIVTFGNYAFMDFILTWVKHLTDIGLENLVVGAMDTKLLEALYWKGVPVFEMEGHMSRVDVGWGSKAFQKIGREKVILIESILFFGFELLLCDTDMVWLKNPLPYLSRFPEADVLTSTDQVSPTVFDDSLERWEEVDEAYNIGIFHWRPTDSAKKFAKEWKEMLLADDTIWDQIGFNKLMRGQLGPSVDDEDSGLAYAYDGNLKLGILPASIFCSGHTFFVQGMYQQLRMEPYAIHTTFQYAGVAGKRHRLREAMVFYDPPEYYDVSPSGAGGFLTFKPSIPKRLLVDGEHNLESHFALVNHQMKQIRNALAVASLLNRTMVMPPMWCRLDKLWFRHPGVLVGSMTRQPFICPLDHVFQIHVMMRQLPEEEFGPPIGIREYSFFHNPSMPQKVKDSWLHVNLCRARAANDTMATSRTGTGGVVVKFPKLSSEETYMSVFSKYKDIKVIQFSSMKDAFKGFTDKSKEDKFRKRVKSYTGKWCCLMDKTPGHIYYDIYWDEKPDWKPKPPETRRQEDHGPY